VPVVRDTVFCAILLLYNDIVVLLIYIYLDKKEKKKFIRKLVVKLSPHTPFLLSVFNFILHILEKMDQFYKCWDFLLVFLFYNWLGPAATHANF
jgi:hypothetical protein